MTTKAAIQGVLGRNVIAVAGVSRDPKKFGSLAYRDLKARDYRVLAINPNVKVIDGDPCYPSLQALPETPEALVVITQPAVTEELVRQAAKLGIRDIWLQQGSESAAALQICQDNDMNVVTGECIMMYLNHPAFHHRLHRIVKEVLGGKPR